MANDALLKQGIAAYKQGLTAEARTIFLEVIKQDQVNEQAWLWLSGAVETDGERRACLEQVLVINPANELARRGLERLGAEPPPPPPPAPQPAPAWQPEPVALTPVQADEPAWQPEPVALTPVQADEPAWQPDPVA